jgi:hypothetical protein
MEGDCCAGDGRFMWLDGEGCEKGGEKACGGPEGRWMKDGRCCVVMVFWSDMAGYSGVCDHV